ncbi:MAG TPA: penicillin-binding protein 2 [Thermoanaerobaculia bacterium]|nr:penicillin-binding protein 2 [Thermoanaerobaculia bacterium]
MGRVGLMSLIVTGLLGAIAVSFWFVQIVHGESYRELAENNRLRKLPMEAPRGLIHDRHGRLMVENIPSYNLLVDRSRTQDLGRSLRFAAEVLRRPLPELQALLESYRAVPEFKPVLLAESLTLSEVARIGVAGLEYPELEVEVRHLRLYRHGEQTAHVMGYLAEASEAEIAASQGALRPGDLVGKKGIEQTYDAQLRGRDGERVVVVDSHGRPLEEFGRSRAVAGQDMTLAIDLDLQQEAVRWFQGPEGVGSVVALDPRNGEILAMVSAPAYNPNLFARRLRKGEWQALLDAPNLPLTNRAIQNTFSPGSVFKIVMLTAGLTEKVVHEKHRVFCTGATVVYGRRFRCWKPGGHGWVDARGAMKHSCDVYFYHLGKALGIERIARYARMFGLESVTGIDLSGEKQGLVPDPAWSLRARKAKWYPGETISVAIGQGPVLMTPMQMAVMTAMVANGGRPVTPHLVKGAKPRTRPDVPLDRHALEVVREGLWAVVNQPGGTAHWSAYIAGLDMAGKTGTVQVVAQSARTKNENLPFRFRDHAWFSSFAPLRDPRLVVVVFAEHGGGGSRTAAPIGKAVHEKHFASALERLAVR